jgi:diguanylate cyclase (GGDEF)-like protein
MPLQTIHSLRAVGASGAYLRRSVLLRLAVFLALSLPVVWLVVGYERSELTEFAEHESNRDLQNLARVFSQEVNATVNTIDLSLLLLRSHWKHQREEFAPMVERLNRELHGRVILNVAVTDTRGVLVFSNTGTARAIDLGDREHIRYHLDGHGDRLFVSRPMIGRITGEWGVQFTRPILDSHGKFEGVIAAQIAPSYFSRFYSSIDLGPGSSITLVRGDGTVISRGTRSGGNNDMGKVLTGYPYQRGLQSSADAGLFRRVSRIDGVERYYAWRGLPDYPLLVAVGQTVQDADGRYALQKSRLVVAGGAVSLLLALLGWVALAAADNRLRAAESLGAAEARWKLALNASGEGVWDFNMVTGDATLSPRAQAILDTDGPSLPFTLEELHGHVHPEDTQRVAQALADHVNGMTRDYVVEHRVRRRDGEWSWVLTRGMVAERDADGKPLRMVGTFANIDARKSQEEQIRHQASHDALTGLPNRLLFADRLDQAMRTAQREQTRLAVLYFDLDRFKPVNDTWGHAVGDGLLIAVAARVRDTLRESDTLARIGGDEFVVLLPRCGGVLDARKVGENILAQLNREFDVDGKVLRISGSVGYALFPDNGRDGEELLRCADLAMYQAKTNGRGQVRGPAATVAPAAAAAGVVVEH